MKFIITYSVRESVEIEADSAEEAISEWEDMWESSESADPCDEYITCEDSDVNWCVVDNIPDEQIEYEEKQ